MNLIIFSDYFHPIVKSGSIIVGDLAKELTNQGHQTTIVTFSDNQREEVQEDLHDGIKIIRIRSLLRKFGRVGRLLAEIRYSKKIIKTLRRLKRNNFDALICYSPSIFYYEAIQWLKESQGLKTYLISRDIFPKWALDAGIIKEGILYRYFKSVEHNLYQSVDKIGIESKSDLDYFIDISDKEKIEVLNNWGAPLEFTGLDQSLSFLDKSVINILYGGNMGEAQDLLSLVDLIDDSILEDKAVITLVGSGNQVESIKDLIEKKNLQNIKVLPEVNRGTYLSALSQADIGLVSLNKKLASNNFPLKMMGYMQLSKPILASVNKNNEIIDIINKFNLGFVSLAGDKKSLNNNLLRLINDKTLRDFQGKNSFSLFKEKFTVKAASSQIMNYFST